MDLNRFINLTNKDEKPLDNMVTNGGLCPILRNIGCIGDSLASGEFQSLDKDGNIGFHDIYEFSWGQFMARDCGIEVYNFSRGGMTAKEYCESFAEQNGYWDISKKCRAYIVALGVNDILNQNMEIGSIEDICDEDPNKCKPTFMGYYGKIILKYKQIEPYAKFFLVTTPKCPNQENGLRIPILNDAIRKLADHFDRTYLLDLFEYAPVHDEEFKKNYYLDGHLNAAGYLLTARIFESYIDYIIRHNMEDFKQIGLVNTPEINVGCQK